MASPCCFSGALAQQPTQSRFPYTPAGPWRFLCRFLEQYLRVDGFRAIVERDVSRQLGQRRTRSAPETRDQAIQVEKLDVHAGHGAAIGTPDIACDDEVLPLRMSLPECREVARIEVPG